MSLCYVIICALICSNLMTLYAFLSVCKTTKVAYKESLDSLKRFKL